MGEHDDNSDFKKAMHGVQRLEQDKHRQPKTRKKPPKRQQQLSARPLPPIDLDYQLMNQNHWVSGEETTSFYRPGLQLKTIQKLKRGQLPKQARLDLHRLTGGEALAEIAHFIESCLQRDHRYLLIIHGKGRLKHGEKPILKNVLIDYLQNDPNVLAYHSAAPRDGGTGALYVILKAK